MQHQVIKDYIWWGGYHYHKKVFEEMLFGDQEKEKPSLLHRYLFFLHSLIP
jgi:hypothetical protein